MGNEEIRILLGIEATIEDEDIPRLRLLISKATALDVGVLFNGHQNIIVRPTRRNRVDVVRELMNLPCIKIYLDEMLDIVTSKLNKKSSLNIDKTIEILGILKERYESDENMVSFVKIFKSNGKDYKKWMK